MVINDIFNDLTKFCEGLSQEQKDDLCAKIEASRKMVDIRNYAGNLRYRDALAWDDKNAVVLGDGEYYVYMWSHIDGTPFYVGQGKGDRWRNRGRNTMFFDHLQKHDAIIYKIAVGLTKEESLEAEFCCIHALSSVGYNLSNVTHNYNLCVSKEVEQKRNKRYDYLMLNKKHTAVVDSIISKLKPYKLEYDLAEIQEAHRNYWAV